MRDRAYPRVDAARTRVLYVRSPAAMKRLTFGFEALAADVYWIRAIQHYGGDRLDKTGTPGGRRYELLYPLLDIATTLDPYFNIAYRFGAIFLGEPYPGGPGRPDQAVALLRKGIAAMPAEVAVLPRRRVRVLLAAARLQGRGRMVPARRDPAERTQLAARRRGIHADPQRRSGDGPVHVATTVALGATVGASHG